MDKEANKEILKKYLRSCQDGEINTLKGLIDKYPNLDINCADNEGLKMACRANHKKIIYYLLFSKELKKNIDFSNYKEKLFVYSAENNYPEVMEMLIQKKHVNYAYMGDIAIHKAIENGHMEILDLLKLHYIENNRIDEKFSNDMAWKIAYLNTSEYKEKTIFKMINEYKIIKTDSIKTMIESGDKIFQKMRVFFAERDLQELLPEKSKSQEGKLKI